MPKIKKVSTYIDRKNPVEFDIYYSTTGGKFFVHPTKVSGVNLVDFAAFCAGLAENKEAMNVGAIAVGRGYNNRETVIFADTERAVEEAAGDALSQFFATKKKTSKVIFYDLAYRNDRKIYFEFKWMVTVKEQFAENVLYVDEEGRRLSSWDIRNMQQISYSEEVVQTLKDFEKSFDAIIQMLQPCFSTPDKVLDLPKVYKEIVKKYDGVFKKLAE